MYGQEPRLPGALLETTVTGISLSYQNYTQKLKTLMSLPFSPDFTATNHHIYVQKELKEASFVLVKDNNFGCCKLAPVYSGPYKVEEIKQKKNINKKGSKFTPENLVNVKPFFSLNLCENQTN